MPLDPPGRTEEFVTLPTNPAPPGSSDERSGVPFGLTVVGPVFFEVFLPPALHPVPGEEHPVAPIGLGLGGVLNTASVAAALGIPVTLLHPAGDGVVDAAIASVTTALGLQASTWPSRSDPFVSLVFSDERDRAFLSAADNTCLAACPPIPPATWVHVGGLVEARAFEGRVAAVRATGARVAVSGCWAPDLLQGLATERTRPWDLLVLNRKEADFAAGRSAGPHAFLGAAADVVITDGPRGARASIDGTSLHVPAVAAPVVDPTGAGDAFLAGLLAGRLRGLDALDALRLGAAVASRVVGIRGGVVRDRNLLADL
jgi:sugar/nucleoside kinase (ribokinase family)